MDEGMEFTFTSFAEIEETFKDGKAIISGTLLTEGVSRNNAYYSLIELDNIAKTAEGTPIYYGTETKLNPMSGKMDPNMHASGEPNKVGKIIRTLVDKINKKIKFWAEIFNTVYYPDIAETVKKGWGVSIGGAAQSGKWILDQLGRLVLKVIGVKINHVQLLNPKVKLGCEDAKVEDVQIQETMVLSGIPKINLIIVTKGIRNLLDGNLEFRFENE